MPFYAYFSQVSTDVTWRMVMIFCDAATADEWWRAVSGAKLAGANANLLADIKRVNPQFYNHNVAVFNILNFFSDARLNEIAQPFRGRAFVMTENESTARGIDIIPDQGATDLISGDWFYVRSKVDPSTYWFYDPSRGRVVASHTRRTMFRVVTKNVPEKTVMIRSDAVTLWAWGQDKPIQIDSQGNLTGGGNGDWTFEFEDLGTGRFVDTDGGVVYGNIADNAPKKPGWELVN
ncbi:hypothetical protein PC9H_009977 [Pleurotus ostreatus]|uniref:Uncharacterized protein n=2 Tax=Pleurotus ostreatus TaxID=5322 RepID=A0A067NMQ1_PLEO1|nr:uncharacterized protein PC9H_009977 [Pleurotus ostreatus]KAF7424667.1 hypothetical protein PC9H_009977 [Pleurotus ostreatus]KAJ8692352.1 hypothetical protein PTI98_009672 [Pleurotus ostreatus]KDQ24886.1 hypothetical protein PLEOSDRAFT_161080 [Pleurotus ostreatus PC15]